MSERQPAGFDWFADGYRGALGRFDATADQREAKTRFIPLFEALNWAVAIVFPEPERALWQDDPTIRGLRFARNHVHHQWADALDGPHEAPNPMGLVVQAGPAPRIVAPPTVLDWFWKPRDRLPEVNPQHEGGVRQYDDRLAGRSVRLALAHLDMLLRKSGQ